MPNLTLTDVLSPYADIIIEPQHTSPNASTQRITSYKGYWVRQLHKKQVYLEPDGNGSHPLTIPALGHLTASLEFCHEFQGLAINNPQRFIMFVFSNITENDSWLRLSRAAITCMQIYPRKYCLVILEPWNNRAANLFRFGRGLWERQVDQLVTGKPGPMPNYSIAMDYGRLCNTLRSKSC